MRDLRVPSNLLAVAVEQDGLVEATFQLARNHYVHLISFRSLGNACWFTNLDIKKRHEDFITFKTYDPKEFPKYDNYDAIEVGTYKEIPSDYDSVMGVPITFIDKYNPDQFEIVGITKTWFGGACKTYPKQIQIGKDGKETEVTKLNDGPSIKVEKVSEGQTHYKVADEHFIQLYARVLIRHRRAKPEKGEKLDK